MSTPTPEERAKEYVGKGDICGECRRPLDGFVHGSGICHGPIDIDWSCDRTEYLARDVPAIVERTAERLKAAATEAREEAHAHPDGDRATYCDGQAAGLRAAMRILDEEARR